MRNGGYQLTALLSGKREGEEKGVRGKEKREGERDRASLRTAHISMLHGIVVVSVVIVDMTCGIFAVFILKCANEIL